LNKQPMKCSHSASLPAICTPIRAFVPAHFDVSLNGCFVMSYERNIIFRREVPRTCFQTPVFADNPFLGFGWVAAFGPAKQLDKGQVWQSFKCIFGDDRGVIVCPSSDDRIELAYEPGLGCCQVGIYDSTDGLIVSLYCFFTGFDKRFVTK
jgi:hypothetical protein